MIKKRTTDFEGTGAGKRSIARGRGEKKIFVEEVRDETSLGVYS